MGGYELPITVGVVLLVVIAWFSYRRGYDQGFKDALKVRNEDLDRLEEIR